ncbi:LysR substrate-binding domain-containing protein [Dermabacter hominis]|uniref:LysR substrate-binding domain-containing protein n=1 Tax=Dermabacter hominis TaxID=36740 RepID=UPI003AB086EB
MSPLHQLARHNPLTLADLADETFIDFPAGTPGRLQSDRAFDTAGLLRRVTFEAMSVEFMLALVERNLGLCLLPAGTVPHDPRVRVIPVTDGPVRTEFLAWNGFNPSPPRSRVCWAGKEVNQRPGLVHLAGDLNQPPSTSRASGRQRNEVPRKTSPAKPRALRARALGHR